MILTRDQLLLKLEEAQLTMQTIVKMQNARANIQSQYIRLTPIKQIWSEKLGFGKRQVIITLVSLLLLCNNVILLVPVRLATFYLSMSASRIITNVLAVILSILMPKIIAIIHNFWARKTNVRIEEQNGRIDLKNKPLMEEEVKAIKAIKELSAKLQQIMTGWFPPDYATMHHVNAFLYYVQNHEADNMKEAIACYKADAHRVQMEQAQRAMQDSHAEMARQQQFGNMLAIGNLIMHAGTQSAINRNTDAVRNVNNTISNLRR